MRPFIFVEYTELLKIEMFWHSKCVWLLDETELFEIKHNMNNSVLGLNNPQWLILHETKLNQNWMSIYQEVSLDEFVQMIGWLVCVL